MLSYERSDRPRLSYAVLELFRYVLYVVYTLYV